MTDGLREQIAAIEAARAALTEDERLRAEAADAPLLRVQLAQVAEELEAARATAQAELRGGLDCARLAVQWQDRAEKAEAETVRLRSEVSARCDLLTELTDALEAAYGRDAARAVRALERSIRRALDGPAVSEEQTGGSNG